MPGQGNDVDLQIHAPRQGAGGFLDPGAGFQVHGVLIVEITERGYDVAASFQQRAQFGHVSALAHV